MKYPEWSYGMAKFEIMRYLRIKSYDTVSLAEVTTIPLWRIRQVLKIMKNDDLVFWQARPYWDAKRRRGNAGYCRVWYLKPEKTLKVLK